MEVAKEMPRLQDVGKETAETGVTLTFQSVAVEA